MISPMQESCVLDSRNEQSWLCDSAMHYEGNITTNKSVACKDNQTLEDGNRANFRNVVYIKHSSDDGKYPT
jgi:hypothetical protein